MQIVFQTLSLTMQHLYWNCSADKDIKFHHSFTLNKSEINGIIKAIATA